MFLGIEIGGTKLQLGVGAGDGTLAGLRRERVDPSAGAEVILRRIVDLVPVLLLNAGIPYRQLKGVGVGFGGPVDDTLGMVVTSHQVPGWDQFPLRDWLEQQFELPVALGNDADTAGLGEATFGMGQKVSPVFYMTIGSGIGGGLIVDGEVYRGAGRGAAEVGHLPVVDESANGHVTVPLEKAASGWAIALRARQTALTHPEQAGLLLRLAGGRAEQITAQHIAAAAQFGDPLAKEILDRTCAALAQAINQVVMLLGPARIVIGGGVSLMGERLLFEPLRAKVAATVFQPFAGKFDIVAAALGEEVVVHGALALARKKLATQP